MGMSDIYGGPSTPDHWKKMCAAVLDDGGLFMKETLKRKDSSKESNDGAVKNMFFTLYLFYPGKSNCQLSSTLICPPSR